MLHSVVESGDEYPDMRLRCPAETLDWALDWLRRHRIDFVSLDGMMDRLNSQARRPFAAFTFDDGFADSLTNALPVMERYAAPMTVYVATGMIRHTMDAWWLGLAAWIKSRGRIEIPGTNLKFECPTMLSKKRSFCTIESRIHKDYDLLPRVRSAMTAAGIDCRALLEREALSIEQLRQLSGHPLVTIGGHGDAHVNLARAPEEIVRREMISNRRFLEEITDMRVEHFAYPFGNARACGDREAAIAREVGFRTAVTTRCGTVFPNHLDHLHALPRQSLYADDTSSTLRCKLDGLYRAYHSRLGDPAARM
jgi:peptidoglycan/xylan/chitin deacetylase (PgdA/CDA1 family)